MFKRFSALFIAIIIIFALFGCSNTSTNDKSIENLNKVKVVVSFNPLREYAEAIGRDKVSITVMVPEGTEPHDFEPKARELEVLSKSEVFVYNGLGMEGWVDKVLETVDNKELTVVDSSRGVEAIEASEEGEHGKYDPHIWLSLKEAKVQAGNIKDALVKVDSANKDYYEKNYSDFVLKLDSLLKEYKEKFNTVSNKNFVTGHSAFAYLCRDYGLKQQSVEGVFGEGEATPSKMAELIEYSKNNNVKTIFVEKLASPEVSQTIADDAGAKVEKIYSLESKEDGKDYIQAMKDNLEKIYSSLK